jgi:cysteinyl-tRNA synthetase
MSDIPEEVRRLAEEREAARRARDFAAADAIRDRIRDAGFILTDTPSGPELAHAPEEGATAPPVVRPGDVGSVLGEPPRFEASVHWIVQGWAEDVVRGIESFRRHHPGASLQQVVVDVAGIDPAVWPEGVELLRLDQATGWADGRNAGLLRSSGSVVLLVDGSVEPEGEVVGPLVSALADRSVGLTGPFGIVTDEHLHDFRESEGPEVDAIEGYLMAFRRELAEQGLRFDRQFKFYRSADIELSFQVKALGLRATVTKVPVRRHEHRMWATTPEERRDRLSKRNYYRFLDRWRGRTDLLTRHDH